MKLRLCNGIALYLVVQFAASSYAQMGSISTLPPSTMEEFGKALNLAKPGDALQTPFTTLDPKVPKLPISVVPSATAARLIFSDRPEYFREGNGIASQDMVPASSTPVRIYNYHVPVLVDKKPKRCLTVFENMGDGEATLKFTVYSVPKADGDYNKMAEQAMSDWFNGRGARTVKIPAHAKYVAEGSGAIDESDLLVHGLFEFTTDQPLQITVAQVNATIDLNADADTIPSLPKIPMLPYPPSKDKANRGNFPTSDLDGTLAQPYDTASGPAQVIVADGKSDPWIRGTDGISGDATIDKGNYGVAYHLHLKWKSTDGRGVAVLLATWHKETVSAAVKVNDGKNPGGVVELPRETVRFHGLPQACLIQTFAPPAGGEGTIDLEYTPPGACSLPMPILLVPTK